MNIDEIIQSVDETIINGEKHFNGPSYAALTSISIDQLKYLKSVLELIREEKNTDLLDQPFEYKYLKETRTITCLNIAVTYCEADVVDFLLQQGAEPNDDTFHHAAKIFWPFVEAYVSVKNRYYPNESLWPDLDKTLDVLEAHHVNMTTKKHDHTLLFIVKRRFGRYPEAERMITTPLANHHATMFTHESMIEPFLRASDSISDLSENIKRFPSAFFPH